MPRTASPARMARLREIAAQKRAKERMTKEKAFQDWLDRQSRTFESERKTKAKKLVKCPEPGCVKWFYGKVRPHEHLRGFGTLVSSAPGGKTRQEPESPSRRMKRPATRGGR